MEKFLELVQKTIECSCFCDFPEHWPFSSLGTPADASVTLAARCLPVSFMTDFTHFRVLHTEKLCISILTKRKEENLNENLAAYSIREINNK